jgi:hypothetical protein
VASVPPPPNVNQGSVTSETGKKEAGTTNPVTNSQSSVRENPNKSSAAGSNYVIKSVKNPLEDFASYSAVWTLACLTKDQFNNPNSYRKTGKLQNVVFSSAGRYDKDRVKTAFGVPEYYINNFMMKNVIGTNQKTGNSNATKFEWDIYEPYSMGLLLQSLQVAARQAGFLNYLDSAPFVLKLEFKGFGENQEIITSIVPKYFVLKITRAQFQVTESGSVYKMEGVPYNHLGFSDDINITYNDLKLVGGEKASVEEILSTGERSLQAALNEIEKNLKAEKKIQVPDEYEIVFPKNSNDFVRKSQQSQNLETKKATQAPGATSSDRKVVGNVPAKQVIADFDKNNIGKSDFGFDQSSGGNYTFRRPGFQVDEKTGIVVRDNMAIDPKSRSFQFSQGQTITAIINQVILSSRYAKEGITPDSDGFITWWKVDVQIELLDLDNWIGDFARKYTFRVVPYRIHHTIFSNPNSATIGYEQLAKNIVKKYNYIYTGENIDILKLDININNLFFTGLNPGTETKTAQSSNPDQQGPAEKTNQQTKTGEGEANNAKAANFGRRRIKKSPELLARTVGGAGTNDVEKKVAEAFHNAFLNTTTELVKVGMEIMGDPYWIVDSGYANYFANRESEKSQITNDGTMNYESGDVFIYIAFRTPVDIDEVSGLYRFPTDYAKESPFSGIYRVVVCENVFAEGMFKQKLECVRMPGQANEFKDIAPEGKSQPKNKDTAGAIQTGVKAEPQRTNPTDNAIASSSGPGGNVEVIDIRQEQQRVKIDAFNRALAEGKSEREADSIANAAANTAGARALERLNRQA